MFHKILIANRGEIAVRIIRACKEMGIMTVAVVSEADRDCLHAYMADETVCIGPASPRDSYLNMQSILNAAVLKGANAIHPGFGFLSENAEFAAMCEDLGITFIGPSAKSIALLGDKSAAKETMKACGVPTIPGSDGVVRDIEEAKKIGEEIGYPLLIKAVSGGGGRGIRLVRQESELEHAFYQARSEAEACFGDGSLYMEKFLEHTRHIEFQILADSAGNVVHLGERDCSLQRRNQKMVEESPSVALTADLRRKMGEAAVSAAKAAGYQNAGTVEFMLCGGDFYFMEMNTRIQVEHPVTEMVTGVDLVKEQIKIAAGQPLGFTQEDVAISGHAMECRINAEDASKGFMPCGGTVEYFHMPGGMGVRFDSHLYPGYVVPMYYDSMLGKLITWGKDRQEALAKMRNALREMVIEGVTTNLDFQIRLMQDPQVEKGDYDTGYLGSLLEKQ